jgi:hypothetical protein
MRGRCNPVLLGVLATLVCVVALGPLLIEMVQIIGDPPPQHPGLVLLGAVGDAMDRLLWSLGVGGAVLVLRIVAAIPSRRTSPAPVWRTARSSEACERGITLARKTPS